VQLLSQCSDLASRVVQTESAKLRADRVHAVEARRLSSLLLELKQGPRITKEHSERAQPYIEVKQRAEALLKQCVERISQVCNLCDNAIVAAWAVIHLSRIFFYQRSKQNLRMPSKPTAQRWSA